MHIYAQCKEGFQLIMHIFMHTFHYLMFSLWHCKPLVEPGIESCSFGRGVPDFGRVPRSICQSDLLAVNCVW